MSYHAARMRPWPVAVAVLLVTGAAHADVTATERAMARELFEQGRKLMKDKKYAQACAKLGESQRLDPAPGTLLNLAVCHEAEGKPATAWSEFNDALTLARRDGRNDRVELATKYLQKLEARLSRLTIEVPMDSRVPGLEVRLDGGGVGKPVWGTAVPVDPGDHVVEATSPGREPWRAEIALGDNGDRQSVKVPRLKKLAEPKPGAAPKDQPAADRGARTEDTGSAQRTAGYVVGALGLVGLGIGGYFGLRAFSRWDERNAHCTDAGCDPTGVEAGDDAERAAMIANVGVGVGLAAVAVGTYLVLTAGSSEHAASARPTSDGHGLVLGYGKRF